MKAVGIVVEYNPFHNGHIYHIQKAREATNADVVIAIMSGNFTQRGELAIVDKWQRAQTALENGVDLIFELPFFYAVQPSHIFADGAVRLLADLGIEGLVFGAEHADVDFLSLAKSAPEISGSKKFVYNETFASQYAQVMQEATGFELIEPNDILAFGYARSILDNKLDERIQLQPIERLASQYHDEKAANHSIASATAIRKMIADNEPIFNYSPMEIENRDYRNMFFELLFYRLSTDTTGQLRQIYQMNEGMENQLKSIIEHQHVDNMDQLIGSLKHKRLTFARIQRTLTYVLMNIKVDQMQAAMKDPYLRLLGYNQKGQEYLNQVKKDLHHPLISHVDLSLARTNLRIDYRAGILYSQILGLRNQAQQDIGRIPLDIK